MHLKWVLVRENLELRIQKGFLKGSIQSICHLNAQKLEVHIMYAFYINDYSRGSTMKENNFSGQTLLFPWMVLSL